MVLEQDEIKEWVKYTRPAVGVPILTVTLVQGSLTSKCSVKCYGLKDAIKSGVAEAREQAHGALAELREAVNA